MDAAVTNILEPRLLELLRCPETGQAVFAADAQLLQAIEKRRQGGGLRDRRGRPVQDPIASALVRADGKIVFRIVNGIPMMLMDDALVL